MESDSEKRNSPWRGKLPGVVLVFLGLGFLLNNYGFTSFDIGKLWPVLLIVPGVLLLTRNHRRS